MKLATWQLAKGINPHSKGKQKGIFKRMNTNTWLHACCCYHCNMFSHFSMAYRAQPSRKTNHWMSWQIHKRQIKLDLPPRLCHGCTNLAESHRFFALLTWIGHNSPETKGSEIWRLKMHSCGRLFIVRLCFTVNLMHREVVLGMDNATGDNERKQLSLLQGSPWKTPQG